MDNVARLNKRHYKGNDINNQLDLMSFVICSKGKGNINYFVALLPAEEPNGTTGYLVLGLQKAIMNSHCEKKKIIILLYKCLNVY